VVFEPPSNAKVADRFVLDNANCYNRKEMASSDNDLDELEIRFQEAHGAWLFQQGRPRVSLEIKGQNLTILIYQARLRG
jgi:hypothetical protein